VRLDLKVLLVRRVRKVKKAPRAMLLLTVTLLPSKKRNSAVLKAYEDLKVNQVHVVLEVNRAM
jgi:hypothetical protein